jgi:hypothetical protein
MEIAMQSLKIYFTGKRAKTGNLCYDDRGRLQVFVTYCDCHRKVVMDLREAEAFAVKWTCERRSNRSIMRRLDKLRID